MAEKSLAEKSLNRILVTLFIVLEKGTFTAVNGVVRKSRLFLCVAVKMLRSLSFAEMTFSQLERCQQSLLTYRIERQK